jgi:hypothetical protein
VWNGEEGNYLKIVFVLAKSLICSRTTSIPLSSEAFSYVWVSMKEWRRRKRAEEERVVLMLAESLLCSRTISLLCHPKHLSVRGGGGGQKSQRREQESRARQDGTSC